MPRLQSFLRAALLTLCAALYPAARAEKAQLTTFARTYGSYTHDAETPTATAHRETFALAEGQFEPSAVSDDDLASVTFHQLAAYLTASLIERGFEPATSPETADMLVVVHRGRTDPRGARADTELATHPGLNTPTSAPSAPSNPLRPSSGASIPTNITPGQVRPGNLQDVARKLGYTDVLRSLAEARNHPTESHRLDDVLGELSQERYYLVLGAYDGRALRAQGGRRVLLWETRLSFRAENKSFADRVPAMIEEGSAWFGRNSPATLTRTFVSVDR